MKYLRSRSFRGSCRKFGPDRLIPDRLRVGFEGPPVLCDNGSQRGANCTGETYQKTFILCSCGVFSGRVCFFFIFPLKSVFLHMIFDQCDAAG